MMKRDEAHKLLVRQKLIDAAEGRLITVVEEFEKAFAILEKYDKTVSIFGSARLTPDTKAYQDAYNIARVLATKGYAIATGGGAGIMEAANKGAFDIGKPSLGFNIQLPTEQTLNAYTTEHYTFEHFFGRKVTLTLQANAYVYCAGGFGTMDELFEILTLQQTGIVPRVPTILFGSDYWNPLVEMIKTNFGEKFHTIDPDDQDIYTICDTVEQAIELIESNQDKIYDSPKGNKPHSRNQ